MATKFLTNIDLNQNQLVNATFEVVGTDPNSGNFEGRMIYNSTTDSIKVYGNGAWRAFVNSVTSGGSYTDAITISESNGEVSLTLNLADTDSAGLLSADFWNALNDATSDATVSKLVKRDANGNIKVATPTDAAHAATKGYVDAARQGLDVKQSVRVATTAQVNLSTGLEEGDVVDGVTLVAGDRVLVKDQYDAMVMSGHYKANGIYIVQETGAAVRAADADGTVDTGTVSGGTFTFVEEGATNADSGWVVSSNGPITVGTDDIQWVKFSTAGVIDAGDGLTKDGNTLNVGGTTDRISVTADAVDIASTYVGQTSITTLGTITTGTWNGDDIAVADGGTGASTAGDARSNLAAGDSTGGRSSSNPVLARTTKQGCAASSAGVSTTTVTHGLGTTDVMVQIYEVATGATVIGDVTRTNGSTVSVVLNGTISANDYTIVVTG